MFNKEMQDALADDGEKLAQLTGEDHGPYFSELLTRDELLNIIEQHEDEYQEVAKALGCTTFFHADILARAKELANFARVG